jgi:hypothetical protein
MAVNWFCGKDCDKYSKTLIYPVFRETYVKINLGVMAGVSPLGSYAR